MDNRIDRVGNNHQANYHHRGNWIAIALILLFGCKLVQPENGELGFVFSETQFKIYGRIGYFQSRYGKIFPFTDYMSNKHYPNRYNDSMFIGYGKVVCPVDKNSVIWPRLRHTNTIDYE